MRSNAKKIMDGISKRLKGAMSEAPKVMGVAGANFFGSSFNKQGYGDKSIVSKWAKRKKETRKTQGKPILVGKGTLRREVYGSLREANEHRIVWSVSLPYAELLNKGGVVYRRGHKAVYEGRPFMLPGFIVQKLLKAKYEQVLRKAIKR